MKEQKIHINVTTGRAYGEKSSEILDNTSYKSTFWATVPQYDKFKARVKKDERGIPITYFAPAIKKEDKDKEEEDRKKKFVPRKCYLFNVEQLQDTNILIKNLKEKGTLKEEDFKDLIMVLEDKKEEKGIKIDKNKVIFNEGKEESNKEKLRKIGKKRRKEAEEKERAREEAIKKINEEEKASEKEVKEKKISKRSIEHSLTQKQKLIKRSEELKEDENMYDYILFDKKPKKYTFGDTLLKLFRTSRDRIYNIVQLLKRRIEGNTVKIDGLEKNVDIINKKLNIEDNEAEKLYKNEEDPEKVKVKLIFNRMDRIKEMFQEIDEIAKDSDNEIIYNIAGSLADSCKTNRSHQTRHTIDFEQDVKGDILRKLWEEIIKETFLPHDDQEELLKTWSTVDYTTQNILSFQDHIGKEKENYIKKNSEKINKMLKNWGVTKNNKYEKPYLNVSKLPKKMIVESGRSSVHKFDEIVSLLNKYNKSYYDDILEAYNDNDTYEDKNIKIKFYSSTAHITFNF